MTIEVKIYENPYALAAVGLMFVVLALVTWTMSLALTGAVIVYLAGLVGSHLGLQTDHMVLTTQVEVLEGRINAANELIEAQQGQILELRRNKANRPDLFPEKFPG